MARKVQVSWAAFSPHSPISRLQLFRGRTDQIRAVLDAVGIPGLNVAIYGERGVGKTSLANMTRDTLSGPEMATSKVICAERDTFETVIRRALDNLNYSAPRPVGAGFARGDQSPRRLVKGTEYVGKHFDPDTVATALTDLNVPSVLFIDEFDRLAAQETVAFADFIKSLSDRGGNVTTVLVGVAEDINALIRGHESVERCIRQVQLQKMSDEELSAIVQGGVQTAKMKLESLGALRIILRVSLGFPHYAHLLAQNAARAAVDDGRLTITTADVYTGMFRAVEDAEQSQRELYHKAITGTKKENLWKPVVTACAVAPTDDRGYFSSRGVQGELSRILDRPIQQQTLAYHLGKLTTDATRGPLLERIGPERRYRYRFLKPFIRPYTIMRSINDGILKAD